MCGARGRGERGGSNLLSPVLRLVWSHFPVVLVPDVRALLTFARSERCRSSSRTESSIFTRCYGFGKHREGSSLFDNRNTAFPGVLRALRSQ